MITRKVFIAAVVFISSIIVLHAGDDKYSIGEKISFKSEVLNEERSIIVYTPRTYNNYSENYPVMYLLDGGTHFHHASGIVQFLSGNGLIPEIIVVAVQNVDRTRDFSPTHVEERPTTGGAKKFMSYLEDELIPFVNRNYRTEPYEILVGHSFGGTFAAYALVEKPDLFNAYIAISPYMMYDNDFVVKEAKSKLKSKYKNEIQFYMTVGNGSDYFATLADFEKIIETKSPIGLEFTYLKMENENHGSIPHLSIYYGLESIYSEWKLPKETFSGGLAGVDQHYNMLSGRYGYEISTPEYTINALGYSYLNKNDYAEAIKVFAVNVDRFPNSSNVYDSLGEAYENEGNLKKAKENYSKSVEIAKKVNHANLKVYEKNLKRVQEKLVQK